MVFSLNWMPGVLEAAGLKVAEVTDWRTRGRAEMGTVRGVMIHHTAGARTGNMPSLDLLVRGRPELSGPLAQLGLGRDGTFYAIAAGRANHAGIGKWRGIETGNSSFIGIECENSGTEGDLPWPPEQMDALRRGVAALLAHIGADAAMACGHREYALPANRKRDPLFDMAQFREAVGEIMAGRTPPKPLIPLADAEARPTLRRGARGPFVEMFQSAVGVVADGQFGGDTEAAARRFQRDKNLVPDGIVGPKTWAVIAGGAQTAGAARVTSSALVATAPGGISKAAYDLIIEFEVSSRQFYEKKLIHPIWPALRSGVTIGIGHDLGYTTPEEFDRTWAALPVDARDRLRPTIGKKGEEAKAMLAGVSDIIVPWMVAEGVYRTVDVPRTAAKTAAILPNCDRLPADCLGVLVSLSFNRGFSYKTPLKPGDKIDRYREMRAIYALMESGQFALIPAQIREMKRIWRGTSAETGLGRRRDAEAALFDAGVRAATASAATPSAAVHPETVAAPTDDETFVNTEEDDAVARAKAAPDMAASAQADMVARSQVVWASDDKAVDYAHIRALLPQGTRFTLRAHDLAQLCALNAFPVDTLGDRILFGLRGCEIFFAGDDFAAEVVLIDRRPDHQSARCVMGVWNRAAGSLAVFPASTVPNAKAVTEWQRTRKAGNLLPTGFYRYITGTHNGRPGCFLLRKTVNDFRTVLVRRSSNDLRYERTDPIDVCAPGDNIHPSFVRTTADFSSFGCQVVVGSADKNGNHVGPWARFRELAGLPAQGAKNGLPFGYVLLTGAEASIASAFRRKGLADDAAAWDALRRLRFGSYGDAVDRLQHALGLPEPDGDFGPNTANGLHQRQRQLLQGGSNGICSPEFAKAAGWQVF